MWSPPASLYLPLSFPLSLPPILLSITFLLMYVSHHPSCCVSLTCEVQYRNITFSYQRLRVSQTWSEKQIILPRKSKLCIQTKRRGLDTSKSQLSTSAGYNQLLSSENHTDTEARTAAQLFSAATCCSSADSRWETKVPSVLSPVACFNKHQPTEDWLKPPLIQCFSSIWKYLG